MLKHTNWFNAQYMAAQWVAAQQGSDSSGSNGENLTPFEEDQEVAIDYLMQSPAFQTMYEEFKKTGVTIKISDSNLGAEYIPETKTIYWNPNDAGVFKDDGSLQSPALALAHEMGHAVQHFNDPIQFAINNDWNTPNGPVVSAEEHRNLAFEQSVAQELGERVRENYLDLKMYGQEVDSVTTHSEEEEDYYNYPGYGAP